MHIIRSETLGETVGDTFRIKKSRQESPDFDIISVYGGAVSYLNYITRDLANFSKPVDKLWDIHNKFICYIFYTSKDAYW